MVEKTFSFSLSEDDNKMFVMNKVGVLEIIQKVTNSIKMIIVFFYTTCHTPNT